MTHCEEHKAMCKCTSSGTKKHCMQSRTAVWRAGRLEQITTAVCSSADQSQVSALGLYCRWERTTLCKVSKSWKPLKAMLASIDARLLADSSKAIALCPLAAAAREKSPCPAPISNSTCNTTCMSQAGYDLVLLSWTPLVLCGRFACRMGCMQEAKCTRSAMSEDKGGFGILGVAF